MATKGKIVFPPGPLILKHIARDKYVYRSTYTLTQNVGMMGSVSADIQALDADNQHKLDGRNLVEIVYFGNTGKVTIKNVWGRTYWALHTDPRKKYFNGIISSEFTDVYETCLFTPVQDRTNGDIFFKASNGKFIAPHGDFKGRLGAVYEYMDHKAGFKVELGLLKRVLTNVQYHLDKAMSIQSAEPSSSGRVSLTNPAGGQSQTVTRKKTHTVTETKKWSTSATVGTEVSVSASVPVYSGSGSVSVEANKEETFTQGEASGAATTVEVVDEISAVVPPGYKVDADLVVITGKIKVPFSYNAVDYLIAGLIIDHGGKRFDDGVFTGVSLYETQWAVYESTLA